MPRDILNRLKEACDRPAEVAHRQRQAGRRIARVLGVDTPRELLMAASLLPVRLVETPGEPTPLADALIGSAQLPLRSRSLLEQILTMPDSDLLVISHAESQLPQLFALLRELTAVGEIRLGPVHFADLKHLPRAATRRYNLTRLRQLHRTLEEVQGASIDDAALSRAIAASNEQRHWLNRVMALRTGDEVRLSGEDALTLVGSAAVMPIEEHVEQLRLLMECGAWLPVREGRRVFLTGSNHESRSVYAMLEAAGVLVVGEDHDWGDPWYAPPPSSTGDPLSSLADPDLRVPLTGRSLEGRRHVLAVGVARCRAEAIIQICAAGDETASWETKQVRQFCEEAQLPLLTLNVSSMADPEQMRATVRDFLAGRVMQRPQAPGRQASASKERPAAGERSRKSLQSLAALGEYQRTWFSELRERVSAGEPLAVVNANAPQEILRALDIPFVVNQWWASIVAAKQQSGRYLDLLREHGYPTDVDAYSSQGLAAVFDDDPTQAPWGGLPRPSFLHALNSTDSAARLFEGWARESGAELFLFERTIDARWQMFRNWWETLPERWDEVLESERLDLLVSEMHDLIAQLERHTNRRFSQDRFAEVMSLVNEQEEYYRRTRDLIARTIPSPVGIVDTMPATMTPQWHRGTVWARDAARAFYEEVAQRVERGEAACPNERVRLMWVGRGMWSEMGFYQRWEASHGAVFVWSMYLALAADGYIRAFDRGRDPLRALAARVLTMGDELRMPTWATAWHVNEARTHGVDGAIALADADPFVLRALEQAEIPVLALPLDNFNQEGADRAAIECSVTQFIEGRVSERALHRRRSAANSSG